MWFCSNKNLNKEQALDSFKVENRYRRHTGGCKYMNRVRRCGSSGKEMMGQFVNILHCALLREDDPQWLLLMPPHHWLMPSLSDSHYTVAVKARWSSRWVVSAAIMSHVGTPTYRSTSQSVAVNCAAPPMALWVMPMRVAQQVPTTW